MVVRMLVLLLSVVSAQALGAARPYYLQTAGPVEGYITVQFVNKISGMAMDPMIAIGNAGALTLSLALDQDPQEAQRYSNGSDWPLSPLIDPDQQTIRLPIPVPTTASGEGNVAVVRLVFENTAGGTLGWTHELDLADLTALRFAMGTAAADQIVSMTSANRLSQTQVDRVIAQLSQPAFDNACITYFEGKSGKLSVGDAHCAKTASPLLTPTQWDQNCLDNTKGLLKDLIIVAEIQCDVDGAVARAVGPAQQARMKNLVIDQWMASLADVPNKSLDWQSVAEQLGRWAPARQNDVRDYAYYVHQLAEQRASSEANQRWFASQTVFRDTLMSELIRASVTQHFKMRGEFAQWCANGSSHPDAESLCFQFATDVAVRLVTIFGFDQLPVFNQSVTAHREAYIKWVNSVLDRPLAPNSMAYLTQWSIDFAQSHFEQQDCGSTLLFPIGAIKASGVVPDMQLLADSQSTAYRATVDRMARNFERFIQALWEQFGGADYVDQRRSASCAENTMDTPVFRLLMPH